MHSSLSSPVTPVLQAALSASMGRIPPLWPLRHFVAVNPFVGFTDQPFSDACAVLMRTSGAAPLQRPEEYLSAWRDGTIRPEDLDGVAQDGWTREGLIAALEAPSGTAAQHPIPTVADRLDWARPRAHWSAFVVEEISKWCAVHFDENQTIWQSPWRQGSLYQAWRDAVQYDLNAEAFGLTGFRAFVRSLPECADDGIAFCVQRIVAPGADLTDFLHRQLTTIAGWAGYAQYRVREDALRGCTNGTLRDLLAIRLAYDTALFAAFHPCLDEPVAVAVPESTALDARVRWQLAYEAGYQRPLARQLTGASGGPSLARPMAQAVFCIDVRSEVFRRHLEAAAPGMQTLGFAGFFGFPVAHRPTGDEGVGTRCPVLLVPSLETCEPLPPDETVRLRSADAEWGAWRAFQSSAISCFSFVESMGLSYGPGLGRRSARVRPTCSRTSPQFSSSESASLDARAALAEGALRNLGLTVNAARLVLLCGHGSESVNNPYASGLDCGACGGHAGDVNARIAAMTLNDSAVRRRLEERGIRLPADTVFVAGLHHTLTDEVFLFDADQVPDSHADDLAGLRDALASAGTASRRERAPSLGLGDLEPEALDDALRARASDISQVRPEWGLANNAALIAAPRHRTSRLKLDGRTFLHDYEEAGDPDHRVLTLILCAPVVVASWINLQYYASRVDPERYGSGNKVLHNVAGGIGVLEGNGGDLRVGLPLQSIHDGEKFRHEPRRLSVFIEARREKLSAVLAAQPSVRQLFDHGWIHLFALEGDRCYRYASGKWNDWE
jgi:uncharacterized protein